MCKRSKHPVNNSPKNLTELTGHTGLSRRNFLGSSASFLALGSLSSLSNLLVIEKAIAKEARGQDGVPLVWMPFAGHVHVAFVTLAALKTSGDSVIMTSPTLDLRLNMPGDHLHGEAGGKDHRKKIIKPVGRDLERLAEHSEAIKNRSKLKFFNDLKHLTNEDEPTPENIKSELDGLSRPLNMIGDLIGGLSAVLKKAGLEIATENPVARLLNKQLNQFLFFRHRHALVLSPSLKRALLDHLEGKDTPAAQLVRDESLFNYGPVHWTALGHEIYVVHKDLKVNEVKDKFNIEVTAENQLAFQDLADTLKKFGTEQAKSFGQNLQLYRRLNEIEDHMIFHDSASKNFNDTELKNWLPDQLRRWLRGT